jgi:hypothetical protein
MSSTQDRIIEKATPLLERGERIELACFVAIGSVSYRKELIRTLIIGLITLVITAGMAYGVVVKRPRRAHLALTNRRLLIFDGEASLGTSKPGKLLYIIPRQAVTIAKSGNWGLGVLRVELAIAGQDRNLRFSFASRYRENGQAVIAMLGDQRVRDPGLPRDGYGRQPQQQGRHPRPDSWEAQHWDDRRQPQRAYQQPAQDWDHQPSWQQPTFQPQQQWPTEQARQPRDNRRPGQDRDRRPQPEWHPYQDRSSQQSRDGY